MPPVQNLCTLQAYQRASAGPVQPTHGRGIDQFKCNCTSMAEIGIETGKCVHGVTGLASGHPLEFVTVDTQVRQLAGVEGKARAGAAAVQN